MSEQSELTCVSCDVAFDPAPTGGFCPDCDTPHPDFEHGAADEADDAEADESSDETARAADVAESEPSTDDASASYCPECGTAIGADADSTASTTECASCGETVAADASYCPACGSGLDAGEATEEPAADAAETDEGAAESEEDAAESEEEAPESGTKTPEPDAGTQGSGTQTPEPEPADAGDSAAVPDEVTLVVNGESYVFEDGDTFGRRDEEWLEDLVVAGGGADELSYISSEHVEFAIEDDGVYVTDISRNGTLLNATELDGGTERVADGDFLTLAGRAEVEVKL